VDSVWNLRLDRNGTGDEIQNPDQIAVLLSRIFAPDKYVAANIFSPTTRTIIVMTCTESYNLHFSTLSSLSQRDLLISLSSHLASLKADYLADLADSKDHEFHSNLWFYYLYPEELQDMDSKDAAKYDCKLERCDRLEHYWSQISGVVCASKQLTGR